MLGTFINFGAIIIGSFLGILLGSKFPMKVKQTVVYGMGLFTLAYGISMFLKTENSLIPLGAMVIGTLLGEWMHLEEWLTNLGIRLEKRFNHHSGEGSHDAFIKGFLTASLVFCVGPMAILGAIENGLTGSISTLAIKSVLDGFTSLAFASTLGIGVIFSAFLVLIYQGAISLLAVNVQTFATATAMNELTAVGGVILAGIAISGLLEIKKIRTASFLPALFIAPLIVVVIGLIK